MIRRIDLPSALSILKRNDCLGQLAVYVHGVWATDQESKEQTDRVLLSLQKSGFHIPLIGFSWDSDTAFSLDDLSISKSGWTVAKKIANQYGPLLAKFIVDFKDKCPNDKLRIIGHSLGSRVILSAIQWLYDNDNLRNTTSIHKKIVSVHLLGAAVGNEQISSSQTDCRFNTPPLKCSGNAIKSEVEHFYNLYDHEDNMLASEEVWLGICPFFCSNIIVKSPYQYTEGEDALGAYGKSRTIKAPLNYHEYDVISKIIDDDDADKNNKCDILVNLKIFGFPSDNYYCTITKQGDNHLGYIGFRSITNHQSISNSRAIGSVVSDWRNERT
jgi:Alpha/beta hydrolase of unknown function (DUF900)